MESWFQTPAQWLFVEHSLRGLFVVFSPVRILECVLHTVWNGFIQFIAIFFSITISVAATYYLIALYSLYMCMTEGALDMARDRNFVLNIGQQMNVA